MYGVERSLNSGAAAAAWYSKSGLRGLAVRAGTRRVGIDVPFANPQAAAGVWFVIRHDR
jgi:hypothetical protein